VCYDDTIVYSNIYYILIYIIACALLSVLNHKVSAFIVGKNIIKRGQI
jgi:hypothetical protein